MTDTPAPEPFRWYDKTTDQYVIAAKDWDARQPADPGGLREAPDCDHCWDGWSSDADGNDTEISCKHCGAVEETDFGRVVRELAECRAALAATPTGERLDAERLARAIRQAELRSQMAAEKSGAIPAEDGPLPDWYRAYAADVAAEYARLSAPTEDGTEP